MSRALFLVLFSFASLFAGTKEDIRKNYFENKMNPAFAYTAKIKTKTMVNNAAMVDSGTILFSPPDRVKYIMQVSKLETSSMGDSAWMRLPDGKVQSFGGGANPLTLPAMNSAGTPQTKSGAVPEFRVVGISKDRFAEIEYEVGGEGAAKTVIAQTIDMVHWRPVKMKTTGGPAGMVETGYEYADFNGFRFPVAIHMVSANGMFVKTEITDYKKLASVPDSEFRLR